MLTTIWLNKPFLYEHVLPAGLFWSDVLGKMGYFKRSSYLDTFTLSAIPQNFPCGQYVTRWSFLFKRFTGVPTVCQTVFTTLGSLRNHSKIHTGATSCSPRPEWIDYMWLFRLLLELPAPTGGRGGGTCLPNLPKYLQQQSCPGQPSTVPSREDKLSVLWKHIFQHFQLEQACEEASHRFITSRLLTYDEKIYMPHCAFLFFLYEI